MCAEGLLGYYQDLDYFVSTGGDEAKIWGDSRSVI